MAVLPRGSVVERPGQQGWSHAGFESGPCVSSVCCRWGTLAPGGTTSGGFGIGQQRNGSALALQEHGDRRQRRQCLFEQLVAIGAEGEAAHVEQQTDVQTGRRLQHSHLQVAAPRGRRPMDHPPRVVRAVVAHGGGPRWVGHRTARADDVQRRVVERQSQASERHHTWIDEQLESVTPWLLAFEKAKRVTCAQAGFAEVKDAPTLADQAPPPAQTLIGPQRHAATDPHAIRHHVRALKRAVGAEPGRQLLPDFDPRQAAADAGWPGSIPERARRRERRACARYDGCT